LADKEYLWKILRDLHIPTSATAAVVIKNLPIDPDIPLTPMDSSNTLNKPTMVAEAILLALGELSGARVMGYKSKVHYSNPWVHEGFPHHGVGSALTAAEQLSFHQDMLYQDRIPDILGLYCLREGNDTNVSTTLLDVQEIFARLPEDVIKIYASPGFGS
jgi:L-asparagine oxygenase